MSYAQKYFARYSDLDGQQYRLEIWVKDFVGTATEVQAGGTPVVVEKNKDVTETYLGGIVPTFYRIELLSGVGFSAATFASENYGDILVKHYIGSTIDFQGVVAPYVSEDLDLPPTYSTFTLQAECGLNFLKNAPFPVSDTKTRLLDIIKEATYLIPSHHFFGFKVIDNTKCFSGLTQVNSGIDFFQTFIDRRTFEGKTYYEVIQSLIAVRDEFFFDAGFWWLRNVSELSELYAQPALTTKLVTYDLEGNYVSVDAAYRPSDTVIRQAGGSFGNLFSQKNIRVNRIEPPKIGYVLNGEFDKGSTNFVPNNWTAGSEPFSSVLGADYFRFVESVFTPNLTSDNAYIQSTAVTWEPYGGFFASPPRDPQKLAFRANVEAGSGISACRFQIIAEYELTTYYLTSDLAWVTTPTVMLKKVSADGFISFDIPNPPQTGVALLSNFDQPIVYDVTIRLFRSERAFQSTVSQASYFTQYNSVNLFKDSIYTSVLDDFISTIDYRGDEKNDRENTLILDSIIASQNSFPYRHGSLFTLGETPIDGFASGISGILGSIYNIYLAQSYLNVTGKRLQYYQGRTFQHLDFSDIVTIDDVSYRIQTYSHDIKNKAVSVRLVELGWVGGIQIDEKLIENNLRQVTTIVQNNSLIPQDFNFFSSVNFDGRTSFGLRPDVRHESVNISEVFLRSEETGLEYAMNWDSDHDLLAVGLSPTFTAKIPQDAVWAGVAAVAITKGQTLYVSGTSGSSGKLLVSPFIANGTIPARFLVGIATENAAQGANVHVMRTGILRGLNTTAWSAGQDLWASTTVAGGLQATVPTAPNLKLSIAFVVTSHAQVGELAVRINTGHYLADAHDTEVSGILAGQLLRHTGTRWENWSPNFLTGATGTLNTIPKFGAGNALVNSVITEANGNIGIGTQAVSDARLHLAGSSSTSSTIKQTFFGVATSKTKINSAGQWCFGLDGADGDTERLVIAQSGAVLLNTTLDRGQNFQVEGTALISSSLTTPAIGNTNGVTANNTWTFPSNVNIPLLPTANTHATSKQYVDNLVATGIKEGIPVRTISLTNITLSGTQTISGVSLDAGDRVLVAGQTNSVENGIYIVSSGAWSRAADSDTDLELRGYNYLIIEGSQANARYRNANDSAIIVGTTSIIYVIYQGAETDPIFTSSPAYSITSQNISSWNITTANWGALTPTPWWNSRFAAASTTGLAEGTNLYFTNSRAISAVTSNLIQNRIVASDGSAGLKNSIAYVSENRVFSLEAGFPAILLQGTQVGAVPFLLNNFISGVSNAGFSIQNAITGVNNLVITELGNVGVGVSDPTFKFEIGSTGNTVARLRSVSGGAYYVAMPNSTDTLMAFGDANAIIGGGAGAKAMIWTNGVPLVIPNGNILINTTIDEGQKLQVNGNVRISQLAAGSSADSIVTVSNSGVLNKVAYSDLNILTDKQFTDAALGLRQLRSIEYQTNRMDFGFDKVLDVPYLYYENDGVRLVNYMNGNGVFVHVDSAGNERQYLRAGDIAATVPNLQQVSEAGKSSSIKLQWNAVDYALITDIQAIAIPNLQQVAERGFNANIRLQFNGVNYATMSDLPAVGTVPTLSQVLNSGNNTGSSRINFNNFAEMFAVTNVLYGNGVFIGTESSTADCHIRLQGSSFEITSLRNGVTLSAVQSGILQVQANSVRFGNVNYAFHQTPVLVSGNKYVFLWDGSKFVITNL